MDDAKMAELLGEALLKYGVGIGEKAVKKILKHLPTDTETAVIPRKGISREAVRDALIKTGTVLEENIVGESFVISVPSGILDLNAALIVVKLEDQNIHMIGYAKEGIIKQDTVGKALEKIQKHISLFE